jgi:Fic family protein
MSNLAGFKWLEDAFGVSPVQPFIAVSGFGSARKTVESADGARIETYPYAMRPESTAAAHLAFAFRYEPMHLEFLARLFAQLDPAIIEAWVAREPTGQYARRVGFLFEWLTGKRLAVEQVSSGNYVDALDATRYLVAGNAFNNQRWRVRDNLPGTPEFCPIVMRTALVQQHERYDCARALRDLEVQFGAEILQRSAVWLTIKESRASFLIENEEGKIDRVRRFAAVMERRCGMGGDPLLLASLTELQTEILGMATRYGLRRSPVFVGHNDDFVCVVDYIAPHWNHTLMLLNGLALSMERTKNQPSLIRAAVASFGFVYIHPMADGNGRISRFLVNDVLRRDGAVPAPFILPISATITHGTRERVGYDRALERLSKPLMRRFSDRVDFGAEVDCEDGVRTNFHFDAYDEALPTWRYPDLTGQVEYLGDVVRNTIEREMTNEAHYLRNLAQAREAVKNHLEGPNSDIDQIIRSLRGNQYRVSGNLRKRFPQFEDAALAEAIVEELRAVFTSAEEGLRQQGAADDGSLAV